MTSIPSSRSEVPLASQVEVRLQEILDLYTDEELCPFIMDKTGTVRTRTHDGWLEVDSLTLKAINILLLQRNLVWRSGISYFALLVPYPPIKE